MVCVKTGATCIPGTGLPLVGGLLVLTTMRIYHRPIKTQWAVSVLKQGIDFTGTGPVLDKVGAWANSAQAVRLRDIERVEPCRRSSIRIITRDQVAREFGIGATRVGFIWDPRNVQARDELFAAVEAQIERGSSGDASPE